jgi:MFS family permease
MPRSARRKVGLLVIAIGTLVAPLDTAVNIAFPSITRAFELHLEEIRWVIIAYVLTYASLMLACGRLGDLLGYRAIFQTGLMLSALGLIACWIAPNYAMLLLGRVLQGTGIALTVSCGPALTVSLFDESRRTRALAFYMGLTAIGAALGPLIGGLLVARWGWPAVFWFRVPLAVLALVLSGLVPAGSETRSVRDFDAIGAALLVMWMVALLIGLAILPGARTAAVPSGLALLAVVCFCAFLLHEARYPEPLIRLSLFRNLDFVMFNAASIAVNLAAFGVLILVPYYLVQIAGLEVAAGGAVLALGAVGAVIGSWFGGRFAQLIPIGRLALVGITFNIASFSIISTWTQTTPMATIGVSLLLQGFGLGLFQVGYTDNVLGTLPLADRGVAGSLAMLTRTIGVVLGATILSTTFAYFEAKALGSSVPPAAAFVTGFQSTFQYVAVGLGLYVVLSLVRPRMWA